jgi:fructan beta-fructosidase
MLRVASESICTDAKKGVTMSKFFAVLCVCAVFGLSALENHSILAASPSEDRRDQYQEPFRPQFHFSPSKNWTNDPNGPIFYKREYHLFYQYNPFGDVWGHMSWGHAVSPDMVHWRELPVALMEEDGIMMFSGSVVVDWKNTSGLCQSADAKDPSCLIATYTGRTPTRQTQNIAFSNDRGRTWTKYKGNPVIDLEMHDFRDPKVFWYQPSGKWIMVTVLAREKKVRFFASSDLKTWKVLSDFGPEGATAGVWECPDLFPLPVEGDPTQVRWVLSVNINPGAIAGGSGNQYFIGSFDGHRFVSENPGSEPLWVDYGKDFYASTSFSDLPDSDGRRIWIGWLTNWQYANLEPTSPWRGAQSLPRSVGLRKVDGSIRLSQEPIVELKQLRGEHLHITAHGITEANRLLRRFHSDTYEVIAELDSGSASEVGFNIRKGASEQTVVGYDPLKGQLFIDRTNSGQVGFSKDFPGRHAGPAEIRKQVRMHLFVDRSSVELFGNAGTIVISDRIFPPPDASGLELFSKGATAKIRSLDIWILRPAWTQVRH